MIFYIDQCKMMYDQTFSYFESELLILQNIVEKRFLIGDYENFQINGTLYSDPTIDCDETKGVIIYFHGGGFVYGNREDLPRQYIELILRDGYQILAVDYPLSPEVELTEIIDSAIASIKWFLDSNLSEYPYFLMGRSAGGYLALQVANSLNSKPQLKQANGLISFYGYFNLQLAAFTLPNRHYLNYKEIDLKSLKHLIKSTPITYTNNPDRFLLYISARQKGHWINLLIKDPHDKEKLKSLSLDRSEVQSLPPLFLATSTKDPDVPAQQSKLLNAWHDNAELHLIESSQHDFDRTLINDEGMSVYRLMIKWMNQLIK